MIHSVPCVLAIYIVLHIYLLYMCIYILSYCLQAFEKFTTRPMMGRKELLKITLRKAAHEWKLIVDLRLTGNLHF
ncbi:putative acyl-CoA oxidase [Helianthus anomalus]